MVTKEATKDHKGEETLYCKNDSSHTQTRETEWNYFVVTFVANNEVVKEVVLEKGKGYTKVPEEPEVPECADERHEEEGKWEAYTLSDVSTTVYAEYNLIKPEESPIITEKTAEIDPNTDVATINLSASSNGKTIINPVKKPVPLDIVMVIDQSGSMAYNMDGSKTKNVPVKDQRVTKAKNAAKKFVNAIAEDAEKNNLDHRISIVGFASGSKYNYQNTGVLTTQDGKTVNYNTLNRNDNKAKKVYKDSMMYVLDEKGRSKIDYALEHLKTDGATCADLGFEMAKNVFANSKLDPKQERQKIVIFITDGAPTTYRNFELNVANNAIAIAKTLKNNGTKIYSIGIMKDVDPDAEIKPLKSTTYKDERGNDIYDYDFACNYNRFLNLVSSNYPDAADLNNAGDRTKDTTTNEETEEAKNKNYLFSTKNLNDLNQIFISIMEDITKVVSDFDNITLIDTISKNFTMTTQQEEELRENVIKKFGVTNNDIIVTRNMDGTTTIELRNLNPTEKKVGGETKFVVEVSFKVTANENAVKAGIYETNTEDAGVLLKDSDVYITLFDIPTVKIAHDRVVAVYKINGEVYKIVDTNKQAKARSVVNVTAPDFDCPEGCTFSGWNTDNAEFADGYQVFDATLTKADKTVTWIVGEKEVKQTVKVGDYVTIPEVEAPKGYVVCGWDKIPTVMPNEDITITAQLKKEHNYIAVVMADSGKTMLICEDCLDVLDTGLTYELTDKQCEHSSSYKITVDGSIPEEVGTITVMIPKSDYQFANESKLDVSGNSTETDSMIVLTITGDTDVTVTNSSASAEHSFGEWNVISEASCTTEGIREHTCSVCGAYEQEIIIKTDHKDENNDGVCDNCGEKISTGNNCNCICHRNNLFSRIIRFIYTLINKIFRTHLGCCDDMEPYSGRIKDLT